MNHLLIIHDTLSTTTDEREIEIAKVHALAEIAEHLKMANLIELSKMNTAQLLKLQELTDQNEFPYHPAGEIS